MGITRRQLLTITATGAASHVLSPLMAAFRPEPDALEAIAPEFDEAAAPEFDVDRLLRSAAATRSVNPDAKSNRPAAYETHYSASATVLLLSVPILSRGGVGSGFTVIEESAGATSIQFGAGSAPDKARGLNRLGFIHEVVREDQEANSCSCAWFAFMTTSNEKSLNEAKQSLESSAGQVPYIASQGRGKPGSVACRVDKLRFPSQLTWQHISRLVASAREVMAASPAPLVEIEVARRPSLFLGTVRSAMLDAAVKTKALAFFNNRQFTLETTKEPDAAAATRFRERNLIAATDSVVCLNAIITDHQSGVRTPFRVWYAKGSERMPPLRFEYQARSFLRLVFEADANASVPLLTSLKENA